MNTRRLAIGWCALANRRRSLTPGPAEPSVEALVSSRQSSSEDERPRGSRHRHTRRVSNSRSGSQSVVSTGTHEVRASRRGDLQRPAVTSRPPGHDGRQDGLPPGGVLPASATDRLQRQLAADRGRRYDRKRRLDATAPRLPVPAGPLPRLTHQAARPPLHDCRRRGARRRRSGRRLSPPPPRHGTSSARHPAGGRRRRRRPQGHAGRQGPVGEVPQARHRDGHHQERQVSAECSV